MVEHERDKGSDRQTDREIERGARVGSRGVGAVSEQSELRATQLYHIHKGQQRQK
jgi:hypothetical protein